MLDKQELVIKMMSNSYIKSFVEKNNLSNTYLLDHLSSFIDTYESLEKCKNCKGLENCTQAKKGEFVSLNYDGEVYNEVAYCRLYLEALNLRHTLSNFVRNDIPENLRNLTLKNIEIPDSNIEGLLAKCLGILNGTRDKGLFIHGDMGVGKTYMCIALANSLAQDDKKVAFVKVSSLVNELRYFDKDDKNKLNSTLNILKKVDYLILDDIGSESVTEFSRDDILFTLLDYRMENKKMTIFTSNLTKETLFEHYKYDRKDNTSSLRAKRLLERIDLLSEDYCLLGNNKRRP